MFYIQRVIPFAFVITMAFSLTSCLNLSETIDNIAARIDGEVDNLNSNNNNNNNNNGNGERTYSLRVTDTQIRFAAPGLSVVPTINNEDFMRSKFDGFDLILKNARDPQLNKTVQFLGIYDKRSHTIAIIDSEHGITVNGLQYDPIPSGEFTYTGVNVLTYLETLAQVQYGEFEMTTNFGAGSGNITGDAELGTSRSTILGNITIDNQTGQFRTPDGEHFTVTLIEPAGVISPKVSGSTNVRTKIRGQFSGAPTDGRTGAVQGVRGLYYDEAENFIFGAIIGSRKP